MQTHPFRVVPILWIVGLLVSCSGGNQEEPAPAPSASSGSGRGGTLVIGSISDVDSWNEYVSQQSFAAGLLRRIHLRLASPRADRNDSPQSYEPRLAESWEQSDDGRTITFRLREAVWSDGNPVTAADVRFTWEAQTSSDVPWSNAGSKEHIEEVRVVDERTVSFLFDRAYPYSFEDAVEGGILPEHVYSRVPFAEWATHDWSTRVVGSGPFLLTRHEPGHQIVLERNPRYHDARFPLLDRVVVRVVPDMNNLVTQLLAGQIDYLEGIAPREADRLSPRSGVSLVSFDYPKFDYIGWNGSRPPFDDPELRLAMTLAIDRQALVEDLLYGYGRVSQGPMLSFWWSANKTLEPWPYDPVQARRILERHGYRTVDETGRETEGRALELELITNHGNRLREEMLVKIQEQLSRIGVRAEVRAIEMRALRQKVGSGDYHAYLGGWVFDGRADLGQLFASQAVLPHGMNVVHYSSGEVDRLLERLDAAEDWQAMKPDLDAIQVQIHRDQPYTFLYETRRVAAHGRNLAGVRIDVASDPLARLERYRVD